MKSIAGTDKGKGSAARKQSKPRSRKLSADLQRASFIAPMLAKPAAKLSDGDGWSYEVKFDGYRAVALVDGRGASLWSRNRNRLAKFSEIEEALENVRLKPVVLDGEIVALERSGRSSFQHLQRFEEGTERPPLFYYVFDVLTARGKDLRKEPLVKRRKILAQVVGDASGTIRISQPLRGAVQAIVAASRRHGFEGIIAKRNSSTYESGKRTGSWQKMRFSLEQEFVIGGFTAPDGARSHFGALLLGYFARGKFCYAGKVGTGFDAESLAKLHAKLVRLKRQRSPFANPVPEKAVTWVKPVIVSQIKFSEWTRDGHLRQPVFLGLRADKEAKSVARET